MMLFGRNCWSGLASPRVWDLWVSMNCYLQTGASVTT
jgi:hypothetical protein